jgi:hypothetical protein
MFIRMHEIKYKLHEIILIMLQSNFCLYVIEMNLRKIECIILIDKVLMRVKGVKHLSKFGLNPVHLYC